jgi:spore coat polysaccharide biosynthesis protein SpsF
VFSELTTVRAFIQARMSSQRFPGKVLVPFLGKPVLAHVVERVGSIVPIANIAVVTSAEISDDPLAAYAQTLGVNVVRGPLDNVFARFRVALAQYPCDWFYRVCGDSPLLDTSLLAAALQRCGANGWDLVTNVFPRTYPVGQSVEIVRARSFLDIDETRLSADDREHVTRFYYQHASEFRICNIENPRSVDPSFTLSVDMPGDIARLESVADQHGPNLGAPSA